MKTNFLFYPIVMTFFITSCMSDKQAKDGLAFIDVKKNYPEKEILLTDIAEITYLHLITNNDDYLYKGSINYITDNTIVVVDNSSGNILFFNRDGTPKSRFNRRGQGPEEYLYADRVVYDEVSDDVFVNTIGQSHILQVYSATGIHKRKITLPQGTLIQDIIDFDDHSLFFYDWDIGFRRSIALMRRAVLPTEDYVLPFYRISKTTGEVLDYIELPGTDIFRK